MAITRIGGTAGTGAANAGSITMALPGSMAVNDLIVVAYGVGDDDFTQPTLAMTTTGYTEFGTTSTLSVDGGVAGDGNIACFYKFHNGTDTNAVTTAAGTGTDSATAACLQVFRGVATVAQGGPLTTSNTASGASGGDPNPPSVSGFDEANEAVVIAGMAASATSPLTLTAPTGYTTNALNSTGTDTFSASVGLAYRIGTAGDPEDPAVFTDSGAGAGWCAVTLVLKVAPAGRSLPFKRRDLRTVPLRDFDPFRIRPWR